MSKVVRLWRRGLVVGVSAAALVLAPLASGGSALAVAQGISQAAIGGATVFGNTPPDTPVEVSLVLRARNQAGLSQAIDQATATHHFLTVAAFADQFGQPPQVIQGVEAYLAGFGIQSAALPDNLDINASGTAGEFDQAFSVTLQDMGYRGQRFHGTRQSPTLPDSLASPILAVLGLTNYQGLFTSHAVRAKGTPLLTGRGSNGGVPVGLPATFAAQHYDATPLYQAGDRGRGMTVGIVTLASLQPSDATTYWHTLGVNASPSRITLVNVDGGAGAPSLAAGSDETALDVEQSGALAPQAHIIVYQAPNTDYGFADAFYQAVAANRAYAVSCSWGESETYLSYLIASGQEAPAYAQALNQAMMEGAAQGISMFAASGDGGAYQASADLGTTNLSVDNPADSPYVTAAGGTTLAATQDYGTFSITIPSERTWGWDYLWPYWQQFGFAPTEDAWVLDTIDGSGGGYSADFPTPGYQAGLPGIGRFSAVRYLTPVNQNSSWLINLTPPVTAGSSAGRALPDLAMNADPQTGYGVYTRLFGGSGWLQYGGTSFVAPQLAGMTLLIDGYAHGRVGFWNPQIYQFAQTNHSPFTPLQAGGTSNDNLYYTGRSGALFNPGSGLGLPDIFRLAQDFRG